MKIKGIEELTTEEINYELQMGGKFVMYKYCFSIGIMTFKRGSNIYFIKKENNAFLKGLGYTLFTLVVGWWGIPWGPIYTIESIISNCCGGKNVTDEIVGSFKSQEVQYNTVTE